MVPVRAGLALPEQRCEEEAEEAQIQAAIAASLEDCLEIRQ